MKTPTKSISTESKAFFDNRKELKWALEFVWKNRKDNDIDGYKEVMKSALLGEQWTEEFRKQAQIRKADYKKIREFVIERVGDPRKVTKADMQEAINFFYGGSDKKESVDILYKLPSAVLEQETKAIEYFKETDDVRSLQTIERIQRLRDEWVIVYEDLGSSKYSVTMPCGNKKIKMYFPQDNSLSDSSNNYTDWDGKKITIKETKKSNLKSKEWQIYLWKKEEQWQWLLTLDESLKLISSLYPKKSRKEQIVAFIIATGFYGNLQLNDDNFAISCCHDSDISDFDFVRYGNNGGSVVYRIFVV